MRLLVRFKLLGVPHTLFPLLKGELKGEEALEGPKSASPEGRIIAVCRGLFADMPFETLYPYAAYAAAEAAAAPALAPAIAAALPAIDFRLLPFPVPPFEPPLEPLGRPRLLFDWPLPVRGVSCIETPFTVSETEPVMEAGEFVALD